MNLKKEKARQTEIGKLPESWTISTLDDLFDLKQGQSLSSKKQTGKYLKYFLRTSNVLWGYLDLSNIDQMDILPKNRVNLLLKKEDLLVCEGEDIGRTAIWDNEIKECYFQNHIHRLRAKNKNIFPLFYMYWMDAGIRVLKVYGTFGNRTTIPNLSGKRLLQFSVPLPPLEEQKKIAIVLSQIQENINIKNQLIETTKELKKSVMKHLFTYGVKGEKTKQTEIGQIPKSWNVKNLSELCDYSTGRTPPRNKPIYWNGKDFPWATISDMEQDKALLTTKEKVSHRAMTDCFSNKFVKKGTLLMSFKLTIGRTCFTGCDLVHNEAIISIYPTKNINQLFLSFYLPTVNYNQYQDRQIKGNTLNKSKINKIKIPQPPLTEQKEIAGILKKIDERIKNYEEQKASLQDLFKSMLHKLMTAQIRLHNINIDVNLLKEN